MSAFIVGLSGKSEAGKDTILLNLNGKVRFPVVRISFADGVREEGRLTGAWDGVVPYTAEGRSALQRIGMTRRAEDPNYWVKRALGKVTSLPNETIAVFTDVRFRNEAEAIKAEGGLLLRVERVGHTNAMTPEQRAHPSETELDGYEGFAARIDNFGITPEQLGVRVAEVIERWLSRCEDLSSTYFDA